MRQLPEVSPYELKRDYVPVEEREENLERKNFDSRMEEKRKSKREWSKEDDDLKECTFSPKTTKKYDRSRSIDDLFDWHREKHFKLNTIRMNRLEREEVYSFKPKLTKKSSKLAFKVNGKKSRIAENRLLKYGKERENTLEKKRKQQDRGLFKPYICLNSRKIMNRKNSKEKIDTLRKVPNGETGNIKYFTASKATASTAQDTYIGRERSKEKPKKRRRARTKSKEGLKKGIQSHSLEFSKRGKNREGGRNFRKRKYPRTARKPQRKGKKDPL